MKGSTIQRIYGSLANILAKEHLDLSIWVIYVYEFKSSPFIHHILRYVFFCLPEHGPNAGDSSDLEQDHVVVNAQSKVADRVRIGGGSIP